ncbi:glycoside hydrolase family protein [Pedobacter roseus]|uniref:Glycoside hydrolase family protein n=1 Tax=Pedobacter roseus TaxID=336820 RepID=A0A7G9QCB1_9SPHI|nr:glycoside hydrolase family protein [Pedobacter roseus]QNN40986.1 glycoside hydrolase family protein [Pedobacter roseus]
MKKLLSLLLFITIINDVNAQITERPRPESWKQLVKGGAFKDRFLAMPDGKLSSDTWGAKNVLPRYVDNGIEDRQRSYWCGDIIQSKDNLYHLYVVGWKESAPKGHFEWPKSIIYHATAKTSFGPFVIKDTIGYGHNVDAFRAKNGKLVLYAIDKNYVADNENGPWTAGKFNFDKRDRPIIEGLSNLTFAQRTDGSYLMVCRGGGSWISESGLSTYYQISNKTAYPNIKGEFEDPVIWRDHIQYNLIVNDWLGRIAYYLRSKDGVNWVTEAGEAYVPGISFHQDGLVESWFKYERMRVFQDQYGRATQANFAVIDAQKEEDFANDNHSSKNIVIPLNPGVLITMLTKTLPDAKTRNIKIKVKAEKGFNPQTDIDLKSLRFGSSEVVNFGKGAKVIATEKSGNDLVLTFSTIGLALTKDEFAPKLLGKYLSGKMLFGYTRVPWVKYDEAILSARKPDFKVGSAKLTAAINIENFGLSTSQPGRIELYANINQQEKLIAKGDIPPIAKYANLVKTIAAANTFEKGQNYDFTLYIINGTNRSIFNFKAIPNLP